MMGIPEAVSSLVLPSAALAAILAAGSAAAEGTRVTATVTGTVGDVEGSYTSSLVTGQTLTATFVYDTDEAKAGPGSQTTPSNEPGHEFSSFYEFATPPFGCNLQVSPPLQSFTSETAAVVVNDNLPILEDDLNGYLVDGTYDWIEILGATTIDGAGGNPADGEEWTLAFFGDAGWITDGSLIPDDLPATYTPVMLGIEFDKDENEVGIVWIDVTSVTVEFSDPTLRILGIEGDPMSGYTIEWACEAGKSYQVQYSESLQTADWHDIGPTVQPSFGETARSFTDTSTAGIASRFYRVLASP